MSWLNVDEIESSLENLAAAYPSATELIACPNLTHEGRRSHVLRIGTGGIDSTGVVVLGGVHAREWVPPDALVALAADLLEAHDRGTGLRYGGRSFSGVEVRTVVERLNLYLFACVNPDGRQFSQTADPMWRKNRRPNSGGGNCIGVDINRNFDFLWDHQARFAPDAGVRTSANPCDKDTYRGPAPASEPETRNVVWLLDRDPAIRWHLDVHSAVPVVLHPWGSDQNQTTQPNQTWANRAFDGVRGRRNDAAYGEYITADGLSVVRARAVVIHDAVKAVRGDDYGVEQAYGLYPTSGASDDYASARHTADPAHSVVWGYTIECGHTFQPAWAEAEQVMREVASGVLAFSLDVADEQGAPVSSGRDVALVRQMPGWVTIPVASANGDGTWRITNGSAPDFITAWSSAPGVRVTPGDFNGNGLTDIALVRQTPGWSTIPIAFANGDGTWTVSNGSAPDFITAWSSGPGVRVVPGDFNGNGLTDIALVRQTPGWSTIPIAFANGDGTWTVSNGSAPDFITAWSSGPGVRVITGDFNGNGLTDIALVRQTPGWSTIPIAFANGDGTWTVSNGAAPDFITAWSSGPGVRVITGDFNGNGLTDIALVRQTPGWSTIPIAFANGDGTWTVSNGAAPDFITAWSSGPGVRVITGDFNGNGLTDIALVRQTPGWSTIPIAFANGDGTWTVSNGAAPDFITAWSSAPGVRVITGDFDQNGITDIALVRQTPGWSTIPIAFANGDGTWTITNSPAPDFITAWSSTPGARVIPGDYH